MRFNRTLWVIQGLLALVFVFAGGSKLILPLEAMAGPVPLPGAFLRFIGVAELLGALGLVLPGLLNIHPELTPIAASGLIVIMTGATALTAIYMSVGAALVPFVVGLLALSVAYGRRELLTRAALRPATR